MNTDAYTCTELLSYITFPKTLVFREGEECMIQQGSYRHMQQIEERHSLTFGYKTYRNLDTTFEPVFTMEFQSLLQMVAILE